jgi:hypothetical protein
MALVLASQRVRFCCMNRFEKQARFRETPRNLESPKKAREMQVLHTVNRRAQHEDGRQPGR